MISYHSINMRNIYKLGFGLVIALFVAIGFSGTTSKVQAFEVRQDKNVNQNEIINGDLFISGDNIKVDGTVYGNVFAGGSTIEISGNVYGNVFAGGSDVNITGNVSKSVYVGAGTVVITGDTGRDVFVGAATATLNGKIAEDALIGGGNVTINSDIKENLYAAAGQISLVGTVTKDAFITTSNANVPQVKVLGKLNLKIEQSKKVQTPKVSKSVLTGLSVIGMLFSIAIFVGMYLLGLVLFKHFPIALNRITDGMKESFGKSFGVGLLVSFASPLIILLLAVTIIGIPFAVAICGTLILLAFLSSILVGRFTGRLIFSMMKNEGHIALELFVGMLVATLLFAIPILGFFLKIVAYSAVVGAAVTGKMDVSKKK